MYWAPPSGAFPASTTGAACWLRSRTNIFRHWQAATGETAHLAVREGRKALFVDHAATSHVIAISGQTGELVPLYCTSHGKALLADFDETGLKQLFGSKPLTQHTKHTLTRLRISRKPAARSDRVVMPPTIRSTLRVSDAWHLPYATRMALSSRPSGFPRQRPGFPLSGGRTGSARHRYRGTNQRVDVSHAGKLYFDLTAC